MADMKAYFGIDIGSTNCKVGVFSEGGEMLDLYSAPNAQTADAEGCHVYSAKLLQKRIMDMLDMAMLKYEPLRIGISGMAEPGLFIDRASGEPLSDIMPWSDTRSRVYSDAVDEDRFKTTGLRNSYKHSVYKMQAELDRHTIDQMSSYWLWSESYILYLLTGGIATDYTLALRSYLFDINRLCYDEAFARKCGIESSILPKAVPSGTTSGYFLRNGLRVPVAIAGHDHVCASAAVGIIPSSDIFLSLGTTGTVLGLQNSRVLSDDDRKSGFSFGLHTEEGFISWQGGIQAFGSSIDFIMKVLGIQGEYDLLSAIVRSALKGKEYEDLPVYLPFLAGAGMPVSSALARGAFTGMNLNHDRSDLAAAVTLGLACELRAVIAAAQDALGFTVGDIKAVGGTVGNRVLMQTVANVLGKDIIVPAIAESTLFGAAFVGAGLDEARAKANQNMTATLFKADSSVRGELDGYYQKRYLPARKIELERGNKAQ